MFLGELHVSQQDRYSVWAQSTQLGRVLYYYTPPLLTCALVETKKDSLSEEVFLLGMAASSTRRQPGAQTEVNSGLHFDSSPHGYQDFNGDE